MMFCTYCGQSFTKNEHLERHILTHTNVRPFKCFTCHMSFARRDILQRHYTVHGLDANNQGLPPGAGTMPKFASRTPIACSNCAKTKTKCDKKFPCSRCAQRNLKCTERPARRASKNVTRAMPPREGTTRANPNESGNNNESQKFLGDNFPTCEYRQPQSLCQPPSSLRSCNTSASQPVQQVWNLTPEEKSQNVPITTTMPPFFEQSPPEALPLTPQAIPSPLPVSVNHSVSLTRMSSYSDFFQMIPDSSYRAKPRFMMNPWNSMPMDQDFDHPFIDPSPIISSNTDRSMRPPADGILATIKEMPLSQALGPSQTCIQTPRVDEPFSNLQIGSLTSRLYPSSGEIPIVDSDNLDFGATITARDGRTIFGYTPSIPSGSCPLTTTPNLEHLEQRLKNHGGWSNLLPAWDEIALQKVGRVNVTKLWEATRDKLLAITQSFLHKAPDIYHSGISSCPSSGESPESTTSNFLPLPPAHVLDLFLWSYASSFECFYPMTPRGVLDVNELMHNYNDKSSGLFILMMIAQGAMTVPSLEARWLTSISTEICRLWLFGMIEKNIMVGDPIVLRSALLFTVQAAWSGDKWQMDIAIGQYGMYLAILRHSSMLELQQISDPYMNGNTMADVLRGGCIQQESRSRLIYSWVIVDQDLSLFNDAAPLFSTTEFGSPMPNADGLWQAKYSSEWSEISNQLYDFPNESTLVGYGARPLSLRDLFRHFLDDEIIAQNIHLVPMHLRLLLHPLQTLVLQYRQLLSCSSDTMFSKQRLRVITAASMRVRLEEVQSLLQRWFELAERYIKSSPICPMMQAALVIFHLIRMNIVTNFPEIERLARREDVDSSYEHLLRIHKECISDVHEAIFHSGQIMRIIKEMPNGIRPPWWPGAIYRAALVLWTDSLARNASLKPSQTRPYNSLKATFPVDQLQANDPIIVHYIMQREGIPTLTKRDGTSVTIDNRFAVLSYCIDVIDEGIATRYSDGIREKLENLAR